MAPPATAFNGSFFGLGAGHVGIFQVGAVFIVTVAGNKANVVAGNASIN
jgi:hypothetical protein